MDGTLVHTEPLASEVVHDQFRRWGHHISLDDGHHVTGRTWNYALSYLCERYPPPMEHREAGNLVITTYRRRLEREIQIVPGAVQAVRALAAAQIPLAVVSGSRRTEIEWVLNHLEISSCFQFFLGAEDYPLSKPAPDSYQKAMHLLGVDASQCLIFEDSEAGMQAGHAAGACVVAIASTGKARTQYHHAHHRIEDFIGIDERWLQHLGVDA